MKNNYSIFSLVKNAFSYHENWQKAWKDPAPKKEYDAIIIGGGGHGLATAYYLAKKHNMKNIAVVEKGWIGGGNTGRNTTIIRSNYLWDASAGLYDHALKLWEGLSQEINYNVMFSQRGVMNLAHNLQDIRDLKRRTHANRLNGIDAVYLSTEEVKKFCEKLTAFWLSPDEWMLISNETVSEDNNTYEVEDELIRNISKVKLGAVTDVSDQFVMLNIKGSKVFDLLATGSPFNFNNFKTKKGLVVQTILAHIDVIIHHKEINNVDLFIRRSFSQHLHSWMSDSASRL